MASDRSRYGLLVSAAGAVLLAVSVFLPWYALDLTPAGASFAASLTQGLAGQLGGGSLPQLAAGAHGSLASLSGREIASLTAHHALHDLNVVLLVLAGIVLVDALVTLARGTTGPAGGSAGRVVALVGVLAAVGVAYRMAVPPVPDGGLVALSLREGSWLALLGSLMMVLGPIWPRVSLEHAHGGALIRV